MTSNRAPPTPGKIPVTLELCLANLIIAHCYHGTPCNGDEGNENCKCACSFWEPHLIRSIDLYSQKQLSQGGGKDTKSYCTDLSRHSLSLQADNFQG